MKLHPLTNGFLLEGFPTDPHQGILLLFQNMSYDHIQKELPGMLIAAALPSQKYWKTHDQSDYVWKVNQLKSLVAIGAQIYKKKLWKYPTWESKMDADKPNTASLNGYLFLNKEELNNPYLVFKQAIKNIPLDRWLDFLNNCIANAISLKYEPWWTESEDQLPCSMYLFKMLEAAHMINSRINNNSNYL